MKMKRTNRSNRKFMNKKITAKRPALAGFAACIAIAIAGCASQRISNALERYGVSREKAECIGDSLSDRLSVGQLQALGRAARAYRAIDTSNIPLTMVDLTRVAAELRDPVIPIEIVRAGVKCAVLPAQV